jgi:hypothetical protein
MATMRVSRCSTAASLMAALVLAAPAAAQDDVAAAKALFDDGLRKMQANNYERGCPALRESYRLDPRPGTLFTLAECEAKRGKTATAVAHYGNYMKIYEGLPEGAQLKQGDRYKIAAEQKMMLLPYVPELKLILPPDAPPGTVVKRDNLVLRDASLGVALPVDPGTYVITTQAPGGPVTEQRIIIASSDRNEVILKVAPPSKQGTGPQHPPPATVEPGSNGRRTAAFVIGGLGLAGLAVGGVMGGLTLAKKGELDDYNCNHDTQQCDPGGAEVAGSAQTLGLVSTIGFAAGFAAVGVSAVLLLTAPSQPSNQGTTTRKTQSGSWVSAGIVFAGPTGVAAGVRGAW